MNRRGFLKSILAAGVAPYVVTTAGVLMPVRAITAPKLIVWGDTTVEYSGYMTATEVLALREAYFRGIKPFFFTPDSNWLTFEAAA